MFSSKSFIVSSLTFRSLIHFVFIFVYGVREGYGFIHLTVQLYSYNCLVFPVPLIEETIFSPLCILVFVID